MKIEYCKDGRNRSIVVHVTADRGFTFQFSIPACWAWKHEPLKQYRIVGPLGNWHQEFRDDCWALDWWKQFSDYPLQRNFSGVWHTWCYLTATWKFPVY